ncbi:MAG TPA: zf-HC2 domain-containing protein [Blastocatellia bacterium]|jgi:hypothetical protein
MTHQEIEEKEIIERYVRHKLPPEERLAFQEHYFSCDECFERAQMEARFISSVRGASAAGVLAKAQPDAFEASGAALWMRWLKPAFALATAASLVLTIALGWLVFKQIPGLRQEIAREREVREQIERENQQSIDKAREELQNERQQLELERSERAKAQKQIEELARNEPSQTNVPIVVLEAVRGGGKGNQLSLPTNAVRALIWLDVEPGNRFGSYQLQVLDSNKHLVETIAGAKPNSYGALVVNVSAKSLQSGRYVVRLYGVRSGQRELVGEYDLQVGRQ